MTPDEPTRPQGEGSPDQPHPGQALIPYSYAYPNDEIDLVEVGVSLWRRWKLMLAVFLACIAAGLLIAFLVPKSYEYSTTVQVGTQIVGSQPQPVEPPDSAAKKVQNGYLPELVRQYAHEHDLDPRRLKFDVTSPEKTNLVFISGKGPQSVAGAYLAVEKAAAEKLVRSELPLTKTAEAQLKSKLAEEQANLDELTDPRYKALLQNQIASLQAFLKQARAQQLQSDKRPGGASTAMSALLLGSQVQQAEQNLAGLQQKLEVKLPNQIKSEQAKVNSLEVQLANLQKSEIVAGPMSSVQPVGIGRAVIAILGAVVGVVLALLIAAGANYSSAVRRRLESADRAG